jgi:hypothetical protein
MKFLHLLPFAALVLIACADDPSALTGRHSTTGPGDGTDPTTDTTNPQAVECTAKPTGRSYVLFDGSKLEESRVNENIGMNRARLKPYAVMSGEYSRVLGLVPPSLAGAAGSFDDPPARWFAETLYSGVTLSASFDISFEACTAATKTDAAFAAAPTAATAETQCAAWARKAWNRTASPDELSACTDLATTKLNDEPDARRRWSYVCASILSSAQFLTY